MLYILTGSDEFSLHQALDDIKRGIGSGTELDMNTVNLDGRQVTVAELKAACDTMPFMASQRLVIVEGLLGRFEETYERRRAKGDGRAHEPIAAYLNTIPDFSVVVLVDGEIKSNPLFNEISGHAEVKTFPPLSYDRLADWAARRIAAGGGSISVPAQRLLVRRVGGNLYAMAGEVDKLLAFARGRRIEEDDVSALVSDIQESSIFALVDAILEYRIAAAENILQEFLERGASPVYLLTMILRQAALIVRAKDLKDRGRSRAEVQSRLGLGDYPARKTLEQAGRYSPARLREIYRRLLETDLTIKTGRLNGDFALNILIADLARK